jgi:hypothetical protein
VRRDVLTGIVPHTMTDPDLWNTYLTIGICSICMRSTSVQYQITDATVDTDLFLMGLKQHLQLDSWGRKTY